jgi:hypothetical protein
VNDPKEAIHAQSRVLGTNIRDFLMEFWMATARPMLPAADDFADLVEPYVEFIYYDAQEWLAKFLTSEEGQREIRGTWYREYMKKLAEEKLAALQKIELRKLKKRFENPRLPNHDR